MAGLRIGSQLLLADGFDQVVPADKQHRDTKQDRNDKHWHFCLRRYSPCHINAESGPVVRHSSKRGHCQIQKGPLAKSGVKTGHYPPVRYWPK
jgi:hypothetical protein